MWLLVYHGDERVFWRDMCPTRCLALYRALMPETRKAPASDPAPQKSGSLYQYLMGGD